MPEWLNEREWVRDAIERLGSEVKGAREEVKAASDRLWYIVIAVLMMLAGTIVNTALNVISLKGP